MTGSAANLAEGQWLLGKGWSQAAWGTESLPDRALLEAVTAAYPTFLGRTDGHAAWLNSAAGAESVTMPSGERE